MKPEVPSIYGHFIDNEQVTERKKTLLQVSYLNPSRSDPIQASPSQSRLIQVNPSWSK